MYTDKEAENRIITIPNLLSAFRLVLIPVFLWTYCIREEYLVTAGLLLLSGLTDLADGFIARRFHMVSNLGKMLDPVADKLTQAVALGCLLTRFPAVWWLMAVLVIKEALMAAMGIFVIRRTGVVYSAAWHGKLAACILYAVILTHIVWYNIPAELSACFAAAGTAGMLLSLTMYATQNVRRVKGSAQ